MSMFGSIAQSTREDRLVLTVNASDSTFNFYDINSNSNVLYEFQEVSNPSNSGSGELLNGPKNTDITFPSNGVYKLYIRPSGSLYSTTYRMRPSFYNSETSNRNKLISIDNWGNYPFHYNSSYAWGRCGNLDISSSDCPLLHGSNNNSKDMNISSWFYQDLNLHNSNNSLSNWDISRVNNLYQTFQQTYNISPNVTIGGWELGPNVTSLASMFYGSAMSCSIATKLTTKYGKTYIAWDTSNITNLRYTFKGIHDQARGGRMTGLSNWDTSNIDTLTAAFGGMNAAYKKSIFNDDISTKQVTIAAGTPLEKTYNAWDVSNVILFGSTLAGRFYEGIFFNSDFNQDISNWQINTGSDINMNGMFSAAYKFNQPITGSTVTVGGNTYEAWNTKKVTNFRNTFYNPYYVSSTMSFAQPIGEWDVSSSTDMTSMFQYNENFNQDLSKWNTSNVTSMGAMFRSTNMQHALSSSYQNHPTRGEYIAWDTSNVTNMSFMFQNNLSYRIATSGYNQDINNWNVSQVTDMSGMFSGDTNTISSFNQDISTKPVTIGASTSVETTYNAWDVSSVTQFGFYNESTYTGYLPYGTFYNNRSFNQPIGNWQINTGSTIYLRDMFHYASSFNQPISQSMVTVGSKTYEAWNVKKASSLRSTFAFTTNFNQDISNWDISGSTSLHNTFFQALNFNQSLNLWNTMNVTTLNSTFAQTPFNNGGAPLSSSYQNHPTRGEYIAWDTSKVTNMNQTFFNYSRDNSNPNPGFNQDVNNWDTSNVTTLKGTFSGVNSTHTASFNQDISTKQVTIAAGTPLQRTYNAWDVSKVETFGNNVLYKRDADIQLGMFAHNSYFNQPIGNWQINTGSDIDVSLKFMFYFNSAFNQNISSSIVTVGSKTYTAWDTKRVNNLYSTFGGSNLNKPIGNWNLTNVKTMRLMLSYNTNFNQDISASVQTVGSETYNAWYFPDNTSLQSVLYNAQSFSKPIGNWNISNVTEFQSAFHNNYLNNSSFATQSVNLHSGVSYTSWDFSNGTTPISASNMFRFASIFEGEGLSTWDVSNMGSMGDAFAQGTNITTTNYDNILVNWSSSLGINPHSHPNIIHFGNAKYTGTPGSAPSASHAFIENDLSIVLTDGGPV